MVKVVYPALFIFNIHGVVFVPGLFKGADIRGD
jgi:hypothetical protein